MAFESEGTPTSGAKTFPEKVKPPRLTLERRKGISFKTIHGTINCDSLAILDEGNVVERGHWNRLPASELIDQVLDISTLIEQGPNVKSFADGHLDAATATRHGEQILALQYFDLLQAIEKVVNAGQLSPADIDKLLDYVYAEVKIRPFAEDLMEKIFEVVLLRQRKELYEALALRKKNLAETSAALARIPCSGIFLLDGEPTVLELSQFFGQGENEAEKNLIVDNEGRIFLIKGVHLERGTTAYKYFPDLARDFHTHRIDQPFSRRDIVTYKSLEAYRKHYGVTAENIDFFVCSPSGIFEFDGDLTHDISDKENERTKSLMIPCRVVNEDTGESRQFSSYTSHGKGESGGFFQRFVRKGASRITISFANGDIIRYVSWKELEKQGRLTQSIRQIRLKNLDQSNE